jgi:hypothetical protein
MKRFHLFSIAILAAGFLALGAGTAVADQCAGPQPTGLGGTVVAGECRISAQVFRTGTYNLNETLHILSTGAIDAKGGGITLNICTPPAAAGTCDLVMDTPTAAGGGQIRANDTGVSGASASPITIKVSRDVQMFSGSAITAENNNDGGSGGNITITAGRDVLLHNAAGVAPGATISSRKTSGAGDTGHGGDISISAGDTTCALSTGDITVEEFSLVTADSPGEAGAITMHAGHFITIDGTVSSVGSTTIGRGGPITLVACCKLLESDTGIIRSVGQDPGADLVHLEACVVEILGLVESTGPGHQGVGTGGNLCNSNRPGKPAGSSACVEIWAGTTILIDATGANHGEVNADTGQSGGNNGTSWIDILAHGNITINATDPLTQIMNDPFAPVVYAVHANQPGVSDGRGGVIAVQSTDGSVTTSGAAIQANATPGGGKGGSVTVEAGGQGSPGGDVNFGTASIQAEGANSGGGGQAGGHIFGRSANGMVLGTMPGELNAGGGLGQVMPDLGTVTLQGCGTAAPNDGVNYTGTVIPALTTLPDACGVAVILPVPARTQLPPANCDVRCANPLPPPPCEKASVTSVLDPASGRFPGNTGPDKLVKVYLGQSVQAAIDTASDVNGDGYIIILVQGKPGNALGGNATESIHISQNYSKPFALLACSVTLHDADRGDGKPTGLIEASAGSPANIFVMDLHGADSETAGWKVVGNGRYMRNVGNSNNAIGMWIAGDGNTNHNGAASGNSGDGYYVVGGGNLFDSSDSYSNGTNGIEVVGNNNTLKKTDVGDRGKGNSGDGIHVTGTGNVLDENDAFANSGNGIFVDATGGAATLSKNRSGDRDKGNGGWGFLLAGGTGSLTENAGEANGGGGFKILTGGHTLKNNVSGGSGSGEDNTGCEFSVTGNNTNSGGNKANNTTVAGNPFPTGCTGTP